MGLKEEENSNDNHSHKIIQCHGSNLFLGSAVQAEDLDWLINRNIFYIVNVTKEILNFHEKHNGFKYHKVEVSDSFDARLSKYFNKTTKWIEEALSTGNNVLVHCKEGRSRSPTVICAFLMRFVDGINLKKGYQLLQKKNPILNINDGFKIQLMSYETKLFGSSSFNFFDKYARRKRASRKPSPFFTPFKEEKLISPSRRTRSSKRTPLQSLPSNNNTISSPYTHNKTYTSKKPHNAIKYPKKEQDITLLSPRSIDRKPFKELKINTDVLVSTSPSKRGIKRLRISKKEREETENWEEKYYNILEAYEEAKEEIKNLKKALNEKQTYRLNNNKSNSKNDHNKSNISFSVAPSVVVYEDF